MNDSIIEIEPDTWRLQMAGTTRIIRYRPNSLSFAPWEVETAEGHRIWSAASLESALRWIQAHTGLAVEALFWQSLLEHPDANPQGNPAEPTGPRLSGESPPGRLQAAIA